MTHSQRETGNTDIVRDTQTYRETHTQQRYRERQATETGRDTDRHKVTKTQETQIHKQRNRKKGRHTNRESIKEETVPEPINHA